MPPYYLKQKNEELKRSPDTAATGKKKEKRRNLRQQTETEMMEAGLTPEQRTKVRKQLLMGNSLLSESCSREIKTKKKRILSNVLD